MTINMSARKVSGSETLPQILITDSDNQSVKGKSGSTTNKSQRSSARVPTVRYSSSDAKREQRATFLSGAPAPTGEKDSPRERASPPGEVKTDTSSPSDQTNHELPRNENSYEPFNQQNSEPVSMRENQGYTPLLRKHSSQNQRQVVTEPHDSGGNELCVPGMKGGGVRDDSNDPRYLSLVGSIKSMYEVATKHGVAGDLVGTASARGPLPCVPQYADDPIYFSLDSNQKRVDLDEIFSCGCLSSHRLRVLALVIGLTVLGVVVGIVCAVAILSRGRSSNDVTQTTKMAGFTRPPLVLNPNGIGSCNEAAVRTNTNRSGTYDISRSRASGGFYVYCDMVTTGGGWLVFQRRKDGFENFYRNWTEYKNGFGDHGGEFWLGNDKLHLVTSSTPQRLRIELGEYNGRKSYVQYENFHIGNETEKYKLSFTGYEGNAGDSLAFHQGMYFSTYDRDNDPHEDSNCAEAFEGAWWYNTCYMSNLNGRWRNGSKNGGIIWHHLLNDYTSLKFTEMKLRPI